MEINVTNVSPSPSLSPPSSSYMQDQPSLDLLILSPQNHQQLINIIRNINENY